MEVLGIDVGGSGIKGAIVNTETGQLVTERHRIPTPKGAKPDDVAQEIKEMLEHFQWTGKVGVGFPAVILNGVAKSAGNIHKSWIDTNVVELFKQYTGVDCIVANDADVAGLAEMNFGAGKGQKGLVLMITAGTGLGSGAFYNGQLIPNFELGTFPYKDYKKVEHYAADSARKRDKLSLKDWSKRLNKFLKIIEKMFMPNLIILGGGSSKKMDQFKENITVKTKIVPAEMLNNAGIVGAAMLCK
ncbi:polyphosphate--glucose phosphotransferase [Spongiivirga sp. MCCC 1A20706]|uniref:polyphosphate--glucose phosphotransferase n=1 Tax=Spongiivirga sp. MCCC 1A20706 TaxID=3160963 RepID=UPI0039777850